MSTDILQRGLLQGKLPGQKKEVDPTPAICSNCGKGLIKLITCNGIASCRVDKWRGGIFLDNSSINI